MTISDFPAGVISTPSLCRIALHSAPNGAISDVVSTIVRSLPRWTTVITWSNCEGDGTSRSNFRDEWMSNVSAGILTAASIVDSSVCLSLQSPYWLEKIRSPRAAGSVLRRTTGSRTGNSLQRNRRSPGLSRDPSSGLSSTPAPSQSALALTLRRSFLSPAYHAPNSSQLAKVVAATSARSDGFFGFSPSSSCLPAPGAGWSTNKPCVHWPR